MRGRNRLWIVPLVIMLASAIMFSAMPCPRLTAQEEDEEVSTTGPIDPAAGSWVLYRGERTTPGQPSPQAFYLNITYDYLDGEPQDGTIMEARVEELDSERRPVASSSYILHTMDRFYQLEGSDEEGFWLYWLTPRLGEGDVSRVGTDMEVTAEGEGDYQFKERKFILVKTAGEGLEIEAEQQTGLVFRIAREGGEKLEIEDTNMLAQYPLWGYYPDDSEVGDRLAGLAEEYPDMVEVSSLGKSVKERDLWLAHITDFTSTEDKRSILLTAAFEGNAPEGSDFLLDLLEEMLGVAQEDEELAELLKQVDIFALPLVNPDGLQRWLAMPDPRESTQLSSQAPRNGELVMIDHNFDIHWENADTNPASAGYAGGEPFSEPESQALADFLEDTPVSLFVNLHTGPDKLVAPWNWTGNPADNPEKYLYESVLSDISEVFPYSVRVGLPVGNFSGSSTDWAYEGNGMSSPLCFNMYLGRPRIGDEYPEEERIDLEELKDLGSLDLYPSHKEAIYLLIRNLHSYLAVDISPGEPRAEVNVPLDLEVEITVNGRRALPNAKVRLVLTNGSGLKLATLSEKDTELGDLAPGSSTKIAWSLEGKASGTYVAEVVLDSSYPNYDKIPGSYSTPVQIVISTQRTWLVLVLLTLSVLFILGLIVLSMRRHQRRDKGS